MLIFALTAAFLYEAQEALTPFLFAIWFAYFVEPLVSRLQSPLRGRIQAIATVYFFLIAVLVGIGFRAGPRIADEGRSLATSLPLLLGSYDRHSLRLGSTGTRCNVSLRD